MRYFKFTLAALASFGLIVIFMLVKTPDRSTPADRTRALEYCADKGKRPPKEFTSDICSRWPDGEWSSCCMEHDIKYWCGGSAGDRLAADKEVRACVNTIKPGMGNLMFWGTRLGGASWLPTSYRWGYGWPWPHTGK